MAPSDAPAETPSVNGVASGLRSSACRTTPAAASVAPTSAPGEHARQPRDEEDLRVDVVVPGDRAIERARQRDRRAADGRRPDHDRDREHRRTRRRPWRSGGGCSPWYPPDRHDGHVAGCARSSGRRPRRRRDACTLSGVSTSAVGPAASTRPSRIRISSRQIDAARFKSCVEIAIVTPWSWLRRRKSAEISSW